MKVLKTFCNKMGIQVYIKGGNTSRNLLMVLKDKDVTFGEKLQEHLRAPSPIYDHSNNTGLQTSIDNFSIVGRNQYPHQDYQRGRIYKAYDPSLNRNIRRYQLSHLWDKVLFNTPDPKHQPWFLCTHYPHCKWMGAHTMLIMNWTGG